MTAKQYIYPKVIMPHKLHKTYSSMIARCYKPDHMTFKNYGGKGITVCESWRLNSKSFYYWALGNGYKEGLTLDRIDPSLGYFPENCRFVTMAENIQSRSSITKLNADLVREIRKDCEIMTTRKVAQKYGLSHHHLIDIKLKRAWSNV